MTGVHYVSMFSMGSGYGNAASAYMRLLASLGMPVKWTPMVEGRSWGMYYEPMAAEGTVEGDFAPFWEARHAYDTVLLHMVPEFFDHWRAREAGKKMIGITVWETEVPPRGWVEILNRLDGLIVPCQWNREIFARCGVQCPIHVAPHVFLPSTIAAVPWTHPEIRDGDYLFYTIGAWTDRKGTDKVVESFCRAFTGKDRVTLIVKTNPENEIGRRAGHWWWHVTRRIDSSRRAMQRIVRRHRNPPRVVFIAGHLSEAEILGLHARADCYVSLTRCEGWGLGAYEAAFHGKPVVMTRYGGQADFLPEDLCYPVPYELVPAQPIGEMESYSYTPDGKWAEPDLDSGAKLMRHVYANRQEAKDRGLQLRRFVETKFRPADVGREMIEFIESVRAQA
jgi:glycosyltransferase involved in cell wall biosynthesis